MFFSKLFGQHQLIWIVYCNMSFSIYKIFFHYTYTFFFWIIKISFYHFFTATNYLKHLHFYFLYPYISFFLFFLFFLFSLIGNITFHTRVNLPSYLIAFRTANIFIHLLFTFILSCTFFSLFPFFLDRKSSEVRIDG